MKVEILPTRNYARFHFHSLKIWHFDPSRSVNYLVYDILMPISLLFLKYDLTGNKVPTK